MKYATLILLATTISASAQEGWLNYVPPTPAQIAEQEAFRAKLYCMYPDWGCSPGIDCAADRADIAAKVRAAQGRDCETPDPSRKQE